MHKKMLYSEVLQYEEGYVSVEQGDIKSAAKAVVKLLKNFDYPKDMRIGQETLL